MTGDARGRVGRFGPFGGRYVPETLMRPLEDLESIWLKLRHDREFNEELEAALRSFGGRPTPLMPAQRLSSHVGGAKIYLKREDLCHTGAHKINNTIGQALLTRRMGKRRVIAETGAGQHGVATAAAAARFGLECVIYMGSVDMERQQLNVYRMKLLGATVIPVVSGSRTLKDAINEALRDWVTNAGDTHYILGSVLGPHPFPAMVREFQSVIGREARAQILEAEGRLPDQLVACVGGGSNSLGLFHAFLGDAAVGMTGVEAGGRSGARGEHAARARVEHAARFAGGTPGVLHGTYTWILQDDDGNILPTSSIAAGLDYPAIGPEHAHLEELGRVTYVAVSDQEALAAFHLLARTEGIIPALESAHAVAWAAKMAPSMSPDDIIVVNLSGRGDKDVDTAQAREGGA